MTSATSLDTSAEEGMSSRKLVTVKTHAYMRKTDGGDYDGLRGGCDARMHLSKKQQIIARDVACAKKLFSTSLRMLPR